MRNNINLNDITSQIQEYVRAIKQRKAQGKINIPVVFEQKYVPSNNDIRSNIHQLNGENKFSIQKWAENQNNATTSRYASAAYEHLSEKEDKHKVVIDLMHKNNRNYDVEA